MKIDSDKLDEWHALIERIQTEHAMKITDAGTSMLEDLDDQIYRAYLDAVREECA